jgi:tagatose 6-phosphate kinase
MILTVTPNPALDVTYKVDHLRPGHTHRVTSVASRPGGKGINVARVLAQLGEPVIATGFIGGAAGDRLRRDLDQLDIEHAFVQIAGETRRTVAVVDSAGATLLNEPGPPVDAIAWQQLVAQVTSLLPRIGVMVCSGSLPPDSPTSSLEPLLIAASAKSVSTIVDTSGPALASAVSAGATVVKPNAEELRDLTGIDVPEAAAEAVRSSSAVAVIASRGPEGLLAVTDDGTWRARLREPVTGNPTGAGDAVVATLAAGLVRGLAWPDVLRNACALSAASVLATVAGEYDAAAYAWLSSKVEIEEV